jgi:hypothetical protein
VLVDCDVAGGGIDVLLGVEAAPGARWSGLRVDGGCLDSALLADGLPRWEAVWVLAADAPPPATSIAQVVAAAGSLGAVVLDLPRAPGPVRAAALSCCSLCVLVVSAEVRGLAAARAVRPESGAVGVVARRGSVPPAEAARTLGAPLLGTLPALSSGPVSRSASRSAARVAAGVLDGLAA